MDSGFALRAPRNDVGENSGADIFSFINIKSRGFLSPGAKPALSCSRPVHEGALHEAFLKWNRAKAWPGRGNPSRPDAAPEVVPRKHRLGRRWVSVRAHYRALPLAWLDGDRHAARNRRGLPRPRKNGPGS